MPLTAHTALGRDSDTFETCQMQLLSHYMFSSELGNCVAGRMPLNRDCRALHWESETVLEVEKLRKLEFTAVQIHPTTTTAINAPVPLFEPKTSQFYISSYIWLFVLENILITQKAGLWGETKI